MINIDDVLGGVVACVVGAIAIFGPVVCGLHWYSLPEEVRIQKGIERYYKDYDRNKDGKITEVEMKRIVYNPIVESKFDKYDRDLNGYLDSLEVRKCISENPFYGGN